MELIAEIGNKSQKLRDHPPKNFKGNKKITVTKLLLQK